MSDAIRLLEKIDAYPNCDRITKMSARWDIDVDVAKVIGFTKHRRGYTNRNGSTEQTSFWVYPGVDPDEYASTFNDPLYDIPSEPPCFSMNYGIMLSWMQVALNGWDLRIDIQFNTEPEATATMSHGEHRLVGVMRDDDVETAVSLAVIKAVALTIRDANPLTVDPRFWIAGETST